MEKIKTLEELSKIIEKLKKSGKKIVQCHGVFDLLHPGHIRHLQSAKKNGDVLVVTVTKDKFVKRGPGRPLFNEILRAETLASLECVDYVSLVNAPTAVECIKILKPDFYVKGQEYEFKDKDLTGKIYDEEKAVKSVGGKLIFTYEITFSSSSLINKYLGVFPSKTKSYLNYIANKYSSDTIIDLLKSLKDLKVAVIGEAIIDQYHYCQSLGKSLKEHLVVSKYLSEESFAGGSLATANHVAGICSDVHLITLIGDDGFDTTFFKTHLQKNIKLKYFLKKNSPTIIKRRYINVILNQKLFELCYLNDEYISKELENEICKYLKILHEFDLVIVSDFGHGFLTKKLIETITQNSKFLAVNTQTNSANAGFNFIIKYPHADYVCLDEPELRLASQDKFSDIKDICKKISNIMKCNYLICTRGHEGSICYQKNKIYETPALSTTVVDRVGAGDAFFAFTAPCFAKGFDSEVVSFIGNAVGALAVQIVGNREPVEPVTLFKFITTLLK